MSTLLQDLLAIRKTVNEDEAAPAAKPEDAAPANPVAAEPVAGVAPAAEAKPELDEEYGDADEFEADFDALDEHIGKFNTIVAGAKFAHWCAETDKNFNVQVVPLVDAIKEHLAALTEATKAFKDEMRKAGEEPTEEAAPVAASEEQPAAPVATA